MSIVFGNRLIPYLEPGQTIRVDWAMWDTSGKTEPKVGDFYTQGDGTRDIRVEVVDVDPDTKSCVLKAGEAND